MINLNVYTITKKKNNAKGRFNLHVEDYYHIKIVDSFDIVLFGYIFLLMQPLVL